jgi:hypothetical protein
MEPYPDQKEESYRTDWQWVQYLFHLQVRRSHEIWEKEWTTCLDKIDQCIKVNVWRRRGSFTQLGNNHPSRADFFSTQAEDVFNPEVIEDWMFDESFGRSKLYFTTLQMLRYFPTLLVKLDEVNLDQPRCDFIHNRHSHITSCELHCCTYRHPFFLSQFSLLISPI